MIKVNGLDGIDYIIDGERYWPEDALKEALGCKDDDIFGEIKKLKEDKDLLEELHTNHIGQLKEYAELALELGIESGDSESIKDYIVSLKKERDELKEKYDKLKARANAAYGTSCGYSASKQPASRCDVVSYSWDFGQMLDNGPIRVKVELMLKGDYNGTYGLEDLKRYIEEYGRSTKKLSDFEVFCKLVDNCIDELCDKYNVVQPDMNKTARERLDYIFENLADYRELANVNFRKAEGFRKDKQALSDSLAELRAKIREIYRSVVDDEWDESFSYTSALNDINEEYKRVVHNFEERTKDWSKEQQEYSRYRLAVESLLDIPKELRGDINAIERSFDFSKKSYESLKEFRNNVCEIFDIPSNMTDNYVLKEIHDVVDRYDELEDFRADICGALDIEGMLGAPKQNDKYILEQVEKMRGETDDAKQFRRDIRKALCVYGEASYPEIIAKAREVFDRRNELIYFKGDVAKAAGLGCDAEEYVILESVKALKGYSDAVEQGADKSVYAVDRDEYDKQKELADRLARLRSDICTALCLGHEECDGNIIGRIHMKQDCHNKLCKDYTELRKAIWEAMGKKPETLPDGDTRLAGEVAELARGEKLLIEFRDNVAKAMGMDYPTTNNYIIKRVIEIRESHEKICKNHVELNDDLLEFRRSAIEDLKNRGFFFRPEEDETLPEIFIKLLKRYDDYFSRYKEQFGLRREWHMRYESEHERANGVQKALDREREKCRVKDISLETAKKQYGKVCSNLETAECAINGMKSKVRELREENDLLKKEVAELRGEAAEEGVEE